MGGGSSHLRSLPGKAAIAASGPLGVKIFMDGCMREMKAKVGKIGRKLKLNRVAACLFTNDSVLLAKSERAFHRVVDQFHRVCSRKKLTVNVGKSKVMVLAGKEAKVVNLGNPYRVSVPIDGRSETALEGERMEVVKELNYLGTVKVSMER